jgi:signal transduction histidine kinase
MNDEIDRILINAAEEIRRIIMPHLGYLKKALSYYNTYHDTQSLGRALSHLQQIDRLLQGTRESTQALEPLQRAAYSSLRHDIAQPIFSIMGYLELIQNDKATKTRNWPKIETAMRTMETWLSIDTQADVPLIKIAWGSCELFHGNYGDIDAKIIGRHEERVCTVYSTAVRRIYQAMHNATKAAREGVPIQIRLIPSIERGYGVIAVQDNGTGMNPDAILASARVSGYTGTPGTVYDTLALVLDIDTRQQLAGVSGFRQTHRNGNGVGLTSSALAIRGGEPVDLETTIEQEGRLLTIDREHPNGYDAGRQTTGTTFRFYFPLTQIANG